MIAPPPTDTGLICFGPNGLFLGTASIEVRWPPTLHSLQVHSKSFPPCKISSELDFRLLSYELLGTENLTFASPFNSLGTGVNTPAIKLNQTIRKWKSSFNPLHLCNIFIKCGKQEQFRNPQDEQITKLSLVVRFDIELVEISRVKEKTSIFELSSLI